MKIKGLILFGILIYSEMTYAQTDFREGYVINASADTIYGEIDFRGDLLMSSICKFKTSENTVIKYSPKDILAFRFVDSKYFVSREVDDKDIFLEFLIKGRVNIYYMRDDNGDHYYLDKEEVELTEMPYEEGVKYVDDKPLYFETTKHIGLLNYYMQDAPKFQSRIMRVKQPEHRALIKLAEDYHNVVCQGEECIIYDKNTPFIKIIPELSVGGSRFYNVNDLSDKFYLQSGVIIHSWMPRGSEKLFFRTGLLFSQLEFSNDGKTNIYKIPIHFEYFYPKGLFRPRVSYGLNIYIPMFTTVSFNLGTNIKLSESLFLSATTDIEFKHKLGFLPSDLFSYSLNFGLLFKL